MESNTLTTLPWIQQIFGVNQIMFAIWQYFEFPACLTQSSIHSTFRKRLWPYKATPNRIIVAKKTGKRKRTVTATATSIPVEPPTVSVTSTNATFASHVTRARFSSLPEVSSHFVAMIQQLFYTYKFIAQVEVQGLFSGENLDWAISSHRMNHLLRSWEDGAAAGICKHLVLTDCNPFHLPKMLRGVNLHWITISESGPFPLTDLFVNTPLRLGHSFLTQQRACYHSLSQLPRVVLKFNSKSRIGELGMISAAAINHLLWLLQSGSNCAIRELEIHTYSIFQWSNQTSINLSLAKFPLLQKFILTSTKIKQFGPQRVGVQIQVLSWPSSLKELHYPQQLLLSTETQTTLINNNINVIAI